MRLRRRKVFRIFWRDTGETLGAHECLLNRPSCKVRRGGGAMPPGKRDHHRQRAPPRIDILYHLIAGKSGGPGVVIVEGHDRVIAGRAGEDQIGKKAKLFAVAER